MDLRALLARPRLSIVSAEPDPTLDATARAIAGSVRIGSRAELAALLAVLVACDAPATPKALDLYGHSTAAGQLRLGDWVIDADADAAFLAGLAGALPRLGVERVRLLGCRTADGEAGRRQIGRLAALLGVEVLGAPGLLYDAHHDADGFREAWGFLLLGSRALAPPAAPAPAPALALDALPPTPLGSATRTLSRAEALAVIGCVDAGAGAPLPGLAADAGAPIALPVPGGVHVARVLYDGAFVRFADVAYPVADRAALRRLTG
jgi:hypothetical protein